jgi:predicted small lipoprotein YifL
MRPVVFRISAVPSSLRRKLNTPPRLAALLLLMSLISACGQKGGLYIPQEEPAAGPAETAAGAAAQAPASSPPAAPQASPADSPGVESEKE